MSLLLLLLPLLFFLYIVVYFFCCFFSLSSCVCMVFPFNSFSFNSLFREEEGDFFLRWFFLLCFKNFSICFCFYSFTIFWYVVFSIFLFFSVLFFIFLLFAFCFVFQYAFFTLVWFHLGINIV